MAAAGAAARANVANQAPPPSGNWGGAAKAPQPGASAPKATGISLERFAGMSARPPETQAPPGRKPGMDPAFDGAQPAQMHSAPGPGRPPQPMPSGQVSNDGFVGQRWRVRKAPDFEDVIVRASQEVTSPELRRILPNETCIQRGACVELPTGLVRMPVEPDGWVTVHARIIRGPTFMVEDGERPPPTQQSGVPVAPLQQKPQGPPSDPAIMAVTKTPPAPPAPAAASRGGKGDGKGKDYDGRAAGASIMNEVR